MRCSAASMPTDPPDMRSLRSMPAQNTGPSARTTATRSSAPGSSGKAPASASSMAELRALRLAGRLRTTVRTGPSTDTWTSSHTPGERRPTASDPADDLAMDHHEHGVGIFGPRTPAGRDLGQLAGRGQPVLDRLLGEGRVDAA